jgi:hypothetical protein
MLLPVSEKFLLVLRLIVFSFVRYGRMYEYVSYVVLVLCKCKDGHSKTISHQAKDVDHVLTPRTCPSWQGGERDARNMLAHRDRDDVR